ncbi:MAG TPA: PBP1A family penicillin-binding protein [Candidatus Acidoferrales bacterium]|nr:PBP1A family penicillin-binding protein [Candidatus Acidoferrales bacterium]
MRIRLGEGFWSSRWGLALLGVAVCMLLTATTIFTYYYVVYARMIDRRLSGDVFENTSGIYTEAGHIFIGQPITAAELVEYLQRSGYTTDGSSKVGRYALRKSSLEITPGAESYFHGTNGLRVEFGGHAIEDIREVQNGADVSNAEIEPELLTNLFDDSREKRRMIRFQDLPKPMVDALLAAEDKRFFEHGGFDVFRIVGAAWADLRKGAVAQGASTLDMQVARSFFFSSERTFRRKVAETMVAFELDHRFTKQQIFELYSNEIYIGNRGSFAIRGFGEAAQAYFGKDIREVNLPEAAFLAGIIRRPNHYSTPETHPERAAEARDRVLTQMVEDHYINADQARDAKRVPLRFVRDSEAGSSAPYFVDMVKENVLDHFSESEVLSQRLRIYTTLDPALQSAAMAAVDIGMKNVDTLLAPKMARLRKKLAKEHSKEPIPEAQVAMVVLDPKTGAIKALVGGRDYGQSQLNRVLARRQPGSAFKPFVYAAAFDDAVEGEGPVVTTVTTVDDEPTTFEFDGKEYTPDNFGQDFRGTVTLREALTHSLNVATIKVAELVGYGHVVAVARKMGLAATIQATPAVALGAYEMTPLEVAAGYTAFADSGVRAEPMFLHSVVNNEGKVLEEDQPRTHQVLDPRVAYLVTNVMEDVINHGTAYPVRARGFTAPAAGKTGSSRDGWFAGYTSNLLCVVWVGFDDNRDLGLAGGASAAPVWAEFMKRAVALPEYKDTKNFYAPNGVVTVNIDPETLQLATPNCPVTRQEVFIEGTQPTVYCEKHNGNGSEGPSWLSRIFGGKQAPSAIPSAVDSPGRPSERSAAPRNGPTRSAPEASGAAKPSDAPGEQAQPEKKKGLLHKIFGIFGGQDNSDKDKKDKKGPGGDDHP